MGDKNKHSEGTTTDSSVAERTTTVAGPHTHTQEKRPNTKHKHGRGSSKQRQTKKKHKLEGGTAEPSGRRSGPGRPCRRYWRRWGNGPTSGASWAFRRRSPLGTECTFFCQGGDGDGDGAARGGSAMACQERPTRR